MGFFRQEYWSGLPFPLPGHLPNPGIEPKSPALAGGFFTAEPSEALSYPTNAIYALGFTASPSNVGSPFCLCFTGPYTHSEVGFGGMGDGRTDWESLDVLPNLVGGNQGEGRLTTGRRIV